MPEITREYIEGKRQFIRSQMAAYQGALDLLQAIEDELITPPMTMEQVGQAVGAVEIGQPQEVR